MLKIFVIGLIVSLTTMFGFDRNGVREKLNRNTNLVHIYTVLVANGEILYDISLDKILTFKQDYYTDNEKILRLECNNTFIDDELICKLIRQ